MSTARSPGLRSMWQSRREANDGSSAASIRMDAPRVLKPSERAANRLVPLGRDPRSAPAAIRSNALIGNPHPFRRLTALPEHVDRHAAAREPVAADSEPSGLEQSDKVLANPHCAILMERAVVAEAHEIKFKR